MTNDSHWNIRTSMLGATIATTTFAYATGTAYASTLPAELPAIVVSDVWSRPAGVTAVVYAKIRNASSSQDRLIGATSSVATRVGLHRSSSDDAAGPAMSMGGMAMPAGGAMTSMQAVAAIPIPPNGTTRLAPGGFHLMLDLRRPIRAGESIALRLHFARAGWIAVSSTVRPNR